MSFINSVNSLRCTLCRNRLLGDYEVYSLPDGQFGVPGEPVYHSCTNGYFYAKNQRHLAEVLEIAGELTERTQHNYRLLTFDDAAQVGHLVLVAGVFYRVDNVRNILSSCRILELEVYHYAAAN